MLRYAQNLNIKIVTWLNEYLTNWTIQILVVFISDDHANLSPSTSTSSRLILDGCPNGLFSVRFLSSAVPRKCVIVYSLLVITSIYDIRFPIRYRFPVPPFFFCYILTRRFRHLLQLQKFPFQTTG